MKNALLSLLAIATICSGCMSFGNTQIRTADAAKARFDAGTFAIGTTTKEQVKARLGSPSEIRKLEGGKETWIYLKTEEQNQLSLRKMYTLDYAITTDVGTHYIAEYSFDGKGTLYDASYRATPMGNPLVR
jgi:hypothetical protein